jgi:hypothetical protein
VSAWSSAPVEAAWALLATPAWWPAWAPHIRRVSDMDRRGAAPADLVPGQHLLVHGPPAVAVRAEITAVEPLRRWDFVVRLPGPWRARSTHLVEPEDGGCRVTVHMALDGPAGAALTRTALAAYLPLAAIAVRRLARLAEVDHATAQAALRRLGEAREA